MSGFPSNPTNGQKANVNGISYTYSSALTAWTVGSSFSGNVTVDQINANTVVSAGAVSGTSFSGTGFSSTGNVTGGNLVTGGLISSTGNVTGGNITSSGLISSNTYNVYQSAAINTTTPGTSTYGIHLQPSSSNANTASGITFGAGDHLSGTNAQAGIYSQFGGSFGTRLYFATTDAYASGAKTRLYIDSTGHVLPIASATYDLGSTTLRWRNVYTSDLHLNNGQGDWTIVEGAEDLFLYNNKNKRVYKFALIEVDPNHAPPKIDSTR